MPVPNLIRSQVAYEKAPLPSVANATLPVGVVGTDAVSVTVTEQLVVCPITTVLGLHPTVVVVDLRLTVTVVPPELAL